MENLRDAKSKLSAANKEIIGYINSFVDEKTFVETDAFMGAKSEIADAPCEGVVSGFADIDSRGVCLFVMNHKVLKGSISALNAQKITRCINNAVRMGKPIIAVWDTSGARFAEGVDVLEGYNSILRAYSIAYGEVPVISIIKGNNFGISAYVAGLSDFVIAYETSVIATASPLVIAAKIGADLKDVGSQKSATKNGIYTNVIKSSPREVLSRILNIYYGSNNADDPNRVSKGLKAGVSVQSIISETFDKDSFLPVREGYGACVTTGFATLGNIAVGVVGVDGKGDGLTADDCIKVSEFLNVCENAETPVIFAVDCSGTVKNAEDYRLLREMSNLIYQINSLSVDTFSLVFGKAIGIVYSVFVSPCEYKIAWDCAFAGALESESAARLLYADEIKVAKDQDKAAKKLAEAYAEENLSALTVARSGHFDNVIEPNFTRQYLLAALIAHAE